MTEFYPVLDLETFAFEFFSGWKKRREELASSNDPQAILGRVFPLRTKPDHVARVPKEKAIKAYSLGREAAKLSWGFKFEDPTIEDKGDEFVITIKAKP